MTDRRRWVRAAALVVALALLGGCTDVAGRPSPVSSSSAAPPASSTSTGSSAPTTVPAPPEPTFTPVDLVPVLGQSRPRLSTVSMVSATDSLPAQMIGIWSPTPSSSELHSWTSTDGADWNPAVIPLDGNVDWAYIQGDGNTTAFVGTKSHAGVPEDFLLVSTDRTTWSPIEVPAYESRMLVPIVGVVDDQVVYLTDHAVRPGSLLLIKNGLTTSRVFPQVAAGATRRPIAVAGSGSTLVVLAYLGTEGADQPVVAYRSPDNGVSWSEPVPVTTPLDAIYGLVRVGSGFVATGSHRTGTGSLSQIAAWSSADGTAWASDTVSLAGVTAFDRIDTDSWFYSPAAAFGQVAVVAGTQNSIRGYVFQRGDDGVWRSIAQTTPNRAPGSSGVIAILGGALADGGLPPMVVAMSNHNQSMTLIRGLTGGVPVSEISVNVGDWIPDLGLGTLGADSIGVLSTNLSVTVEANEDWNRDWVTSPYAWSPAGGLTAHPWDPPELSGEYSVERYTSASGAEVVLARGWDHLKNITRVHGYYRDGIAAPWQPVTGLGAANGDAIYAVFQSGGLWIAYGSAGVKHHSGLAWTSTDGHHWERDIGLGKLRPDSGLNEHCTLPDGRPLIVGSWRDDNGADHPLAGAYDVDTGWNWTSAAGSPTGYFNACATNGGETVVTGQFANTTGTYITSDGLVFTERASPEAAPNGAAVLVTAGRPEPAYPQDSQRIGVSRVGSGFYSTGIVRTPDFWGEVVWLSRDGVTWRWVPIRTGFASWGMDSALVGDELFVLIHTVAGPQAWQVSGLAAALG